ncbi:MAG: benzoyl-CoA reductase subunit D [Planctomycetes bacterium]|nr:benzoyl-CoA reductase subunit D [Planctomycetota bacterium]
MIVAGIDVGSASVQVVLMEDRGPAGAKLLAWRSERLRRREPEQVAEDAFEECLQEAGLARDALGYVATTGEGECVPFRTGHFYGMTAHARGGIWLAPQARSIIDVGALHARAVQMDEHSKVLGYRMTSQCASGSGQFLENICRYLGVTIDEVGPLSLQADNPETCSAICAVLAETDVINMVSREISTANIIRGIHDSMAGRFAKLLRSLGVEGTVLVTGGLAADVGLVAALRDACEAKSGDLEIVTHEHSALAGAIGAALWGAFRARKLASKGLALSAGGAA